MNEMISGILSRLNKVSGPDKNGWYTALCPFHDDQHHPNLRFNEKGFKCLACGEKGAIRLVAEKLGLQPESRKRDARRISDNYDYKDENGKLLFQVVRYEPKSFAQRRPDGNGGWIWNLDGVRRVLFRLPELQTAPPNVPVFIPEGEKDVRALVSLGFVATCNPGGAGKFTADMREPLKNRLVAVIADKDDPGRRHAEQVAALLHGYSSTVKTLELPGDHVKDAADWVAAGGTREKLLALVKATHPWHLPDYPNLIKSIVGYVRRFVVLSHQQAELTALWVLHTHTFESADATPYLNINSAEKRSGKTRLLETLELIVSRPWLTGRITAAVLARKVDKECPTLLLDESDAAFKGEKEYAEILRALLNTGYRRSGKTSICVGKGADMGYKDLSTFCPKAIAGIGKLPDTVADRSIPIVLKRRTSDEPVERFRRRVIESEANIIKEQIVKWAATYQGKLDVPIPNELDDRAADCLESIFAIADSLGGEWPARIREAAVAIMTGESRQDMSLGIKLLEDIQTVFGPDTEQIATTELITQLKNLEESPWDGQGPSLDSRRLASLLKPYSIKPKNIRVGEKIPKGYRREDFADAWKRYCSSHLPFSSATSATPGSTRDQENSENIRYTTNEATNNVADNPQAQASFNVADVADNLPENQEVSETSQEKEDQRDGSNETSNSPGEEERPSDADQNPNTEEEI